MKDANPNTVRCDTNSQLKTGVLAAQKERRSSALNAVSRLQWPASGQEPPRSERGRKLVMTTAISRRMLLPILAEAS